MFNENENLIAELKKENEVTKYRQIPIPVGIL